MNILDVGIILVLIMAFIVGFKRGFIKEVVSLLGILAVFIISFLLMKPLGSILCTFLPFFHFAGTIKGMVVLNIIIYQIIAFIIVFSILLSVYAILIKISGVIQKIVHMTIILWLPSKVLGGIVALITSYIVTFVVMIVLMIPLGASPVFTESKIVNFMLNKTPILAQSTNNIVSSVTEIYNIGAQVSNGTMNTTEANERTLDRMLGHKVVEKTTIIKLIELKKIENSSGINNILNKY